VCGGDISGPSNVSAVDEHRVRRIFEVPVLVAALLVIPVIAIEESDVTQTWKVAAEVTNWLIWIVFAAEVAAYLAVMRGRRLRWLRENPLEVAIVVLTPPFLPASLQALRAFRLLRLIRLLRLAKLARAAFSAEGLRYASVIALLTVLGGGAGFADVEKDRSTWDGVWWAITTMTTVGYGDLSPESTTGRLIGIVVMAVGIGFVALLTGAIAERFLAPQIEVVEQELAGVEDSEDEVAEELRAIAERLLALEVRLAR
jgi:voltage-gated potassium channel